MTPISAKFEPRPPREGISGFVLEPLPNVVLRAGPRAAAVAPPAMRSLGATLAEPRRADFLAGRAWAARALMALGARSADVARSVDGQPSWPQGIAGSISHSARHAAAAVAWSRDWSALGVDIENDEALPEDAASVALTRNELAALAAQLPSEPLRHGRLPFAAKECVHKALNPLRGAWLEFEEVEINFSNPRAERGSWSPQPLSVAAGAAFKGLHLEGRWWRREGCLLVLLGARF